MAKQRINLGMQLDDDACCRITRTDRRKLKRARAKARRRLERLDPEGAAAMEGRYHGWWS